LPVLRPKEPDVDLAPLKTSNVFSTCFASVPGSPGLTTTALGERGTVVLGTVDDPSPVIVLDHRPGGTPTGLNVPNAAQRPWSAMYTRVYVAFCSQAVPLRATG
jgi:hypothetical protein